MAAIYRDERVPLVEMVLTSRPWCEAQLPGCGGRSTDVHERAPRSAHRPGVAMLDRENLVALCHPCHAWITDHPAEAIAAGLSMSRHGYVPYVDTQPAIVPTAVTPDPTDPDPW